MAHALTWTVALQWRSGAFVALIGCTDRDATHRSGHGRDAHTALARALGVRSVMFESAADEHSALADIEKRRAFRVSVQGRVVRYLH